MKQALRDRLEEIRLAVLFLTRLPAGRLADPAPPLSAALWAFPLVGVLIGGLCAGVWLTLHTWGMPPYLAACLALATSAMLTGALHFDGLADVADGLGGGRDREHALEIMRDSRIGSYGTLALILTSAIWIAALAEVPPEKTAIALIATATLSRTAMLTVLLKLPPARDNGLGKAAGGEGLAPLLPGLLTSAVLLILTGPGAVAAFIATLSMTAFIARKALKRIGGQTGDVCGATQLLAETAALAALTLA
jgi:adenosylcobinamide-GDP ribazoletransferase